MPPAMGFAAGPAALPPVLPAAAAARRRQVGRACGPAGRPPWGSGPVQPAGVQKSTSARSQQLGTPASSAAVRHLGSAPPGLPLLRRMRLGQRRQRQLTTPCRAASSTGGAAGGADDSKVFRLQANLTIRRVGKAVKRMLALLSMWGKHPNFRVALQFVQFVLAIVFVALYVYGTYSPPAPDSFRAHFDIALCAVFAVEYIHRMLTSESKLRMMSSLWNVCDLLSFAPPLFEVALRFTGTPLSLGGIDLRWTKILRSMRMLRVGLLSSELRSIHLSTRRGGWLSAGTNFRMFQLLTSVLILMFTTSSVIQIVEKMPFHQALYLVVTTLTTVGFGDVVATSMLGKAIILATICVGVVAIPVQAAQLYAEFTARRVVRGSVPTGDWRSPMVLLSTRLTEVRAFSDFYSEFQQALAQSPLFPTNTKMLVLCNRPSYEFGAFQELHEQRITFMEGSAVSVQDLVSARAEKARACLLLADRFTTDPEQEDLSILFQVWAMKSYTKTVPLYVQTVRQSTVGQISPFLDPGQDVIVSMEQTRMRLLALSAVCPGASTLIGNLLKSTAVRKLQSQQRTLAGREWLRAYVNGCAFQFIHSPVPLHLAGQRYMDVAQWLFWSSGVVLIGLIDSRERMMVNPADLALPSAATLVVVGPSKRAVLKALKQPFSRLRESELMRLRYLPDELAREAAEKEAVANASCRQSWMAGTAPDDAYEPTSTSSSNGSGAGAESSGGSGSGGREAAAAPPSAEATAAAVAALEVAAATACVGDGDSDEEDEVAFCVPLLVGNPDSESVDADSVPCVPVATARRLTTPAAVKYFVQEYQNNWQAQQEQAERGALRWETADRLAAEATAAAAAAWRMQEQRDANLTVNYGSCVVDWEKDAEPIPWRRYPIPGAPSAAASGGPVAGTAYSAAASGGASASSGGGSASGGRSGSGSGVGVSSRYRGGSSGAIVGFSDAMAAAAGYDDDEDALEACASPAVLSPRELTGHFIVCGAEESFASFIDHLRRCGPADTPIVVLHPTRPEAVCEDNWRGGGASSGRGGGRGPVLYVEGSASEANSLRQAGASTARALIYLAKTARPVRSAQGTGGAVEKERSTREAVLADAQALLAVYGVGEESGAELTHAVVELLFTTSIEFLQPGLLLKGVNLLYDDSNIPAGQPRKSWVMRSWQQREAVSEGLCEWQANPYFAAGRVTVPALLDTFACQSFFNEGVLIDLLAELSGDVDHNCGGGAALQQVPVPAGLAGRPYGELFMHLALSQRLVCLGLYRRKSENPGTRLSYVVASPQWHLLLEATDRVFVLRPRMV